MTKLDKEIWLLIISLVLTFLFLMGVDCFAQEINQKYSYKDFRDMNFLDIDAVEFSDTIIVGTCFSQTLWYKNKPRRVKIFPDDITGVIFKECNLDNVYIPPGNTVDGGTNKFFKTMEDGQFWILDENNRKPIAPLDPAIFDEFGWSKDPKDIPTEINVKHLLKEEELNDPNFLGNLTATGNMINKKTKVKYDDDTEENDADTVDVNQQMKDKKIKDAIKEAKRKEAKEND